MAQYDLLLTQNVHASGVEFSEKYVNIAKGGLLSADTSGTPTVLPAGTNGHMLVRDDAEATGLKWQAISAGHTQNTDTGTTNTTFQIDSDASGPKVKNNAGVLEVRNAADDADADLKAANATFSKVTVSAAPVAGTDLTNKTYVDGLLGANNAMVYKGVQDCSANPNYPAANAGDTYIISVAGKIGGVSGINVEVGDMLICKTDSTASGDQATVGAQWTIIQTNIDGAVVGPASSTSGNFASFNGVTGKIIQDSGFSSSSFSASGHNHDSTYVAKATFDANTILKADTDNTPAALTVGASTLVGRGSSGSIAALSPADAMNVLWVAAPATKTSTGTSGQIAKDANFIYVCTASNTWKRAPLATNW